MTERPILFNGAMVRAVLAATKTQTRRIWKMPRGCSWYDTLGGEHEGHIQDDEGPWCGSVDEVRCPYGRPGDRLWVRETWGYNPDHPGRIASACYRADPGHEHDGIRWTPSIHMPRAASRISLEVTGIRVERLQDISETDALAEGIVSLPHLNGFGLPDGSHFHAADPRQSYFSLWEAINGLGSVEANPWVWAVSFRRIEE
jgi:hypothetical protein